LPRPARNWCASPSTATRRRRRAAHPRPAGWGVDRAAGRRLPLYRPQAAADHPACAEALAKYRINPGNVGFKRQKDRSSARSSKGDEEYDKPVRIGVNWGSLDQELLTQLMDENAETARH
jgi:hypothetical protein